MQTTKRILIKLLLLLIVHCYVNGQEESTMALSLKACIDYTMENHASIQKAMLDIDKAKFSMDELKSDYLPQVQLNAGVFYHPELPTQLAPGRLFSLGTDGVPFQFGRNLETGFNVSVSQIIYDPVFSIGKQGAEQFEQLNLVLLEKSKEDQAFEVAKLYY